VNVDHLGLCGERNGERGNDRELEEFFHRVSILVIIERAFKRIDSASPNTRQ
jgi:hypothetical protein